MFALRYFSPDYFPSRYFTTGAPALSASASTTFAEVVAAGTIASLANLTSSAITTFSPDIATASALAILAASGQHLLDVRAVGDATVQGGGMLPFGAGIHLRRKPLWFRGR